MLLQVMFGAHGVGFPEAFYPGIRDSTVPNLWVAGLRCHSSVDTGAASDTPSGINAENVGVLPASGTNTYVWLDVHTHTPFDQSMSKLTPCDQSMSMLKIWAVFSQLNS